MITGFPTETEQDHQDTLSLMEYVKYNFGYMYSYSERPEHWREERWMMMLLKKKSQTLARNCRLATKHAWSRSEEFIGQTVEVLVESFKKSTEEFSGRNSQSITVVFQGEL
jgi:tRNA-2-methylthio-N6-dimethylallyladenosine synthase